MKQHEREFFVSQIRAGIILYKGLEIRPISVIDAYRSQEIYKASYEEALADGLMPETELEQWMLDAGLLAPENAVAIQKSQKDIQQFKKDIFNHFNEPGKREQIRRFLRGAEGFWQKKMMEKAEYAVMTADNAAKTDVALFLMKTRTFKDNKPYTFNDIDITEILEYYTSTLLSEKQIRTLARSDTWKNVWSIRKHIKSLLVLDDNYEVTVNQKALLQWSQVYDNIQESIDCPTDEIIADDDALDGWFLIEEDKRSKNKSENDFENKTKSDKIKKASEVFVMANSKESRDRVDNMNNTHSQHIKKQRYNTIKKHGTVEQQQFADEKLKIRTQATQQYKDTVRRR